MAEHFQSSSERKVAVEPHSKGMGPLFEAALKTPVADATETEDRSGQSETHPLRDLLASILTDAEQ
jgi:hypothetical protein